MFGIHGEMQQNGVISVLHVENKVWGVDAFTIVQDGKNYIAYSNPLDTQGYKHPLAKGDSLQRVMLAAIAWYTTEVVGSTTGTIYKSGNNGSKHGSTLNATMRMRMHEFIPQPIMASDDKGETWRQLHWWEPGSAEFTEVK